MEGIGRGGVCRLAWGGSMPPEGGSAAYQDYRYNGTVTMSQCPDEQVLEHYTLKCLDEAAAAARLEEHLLLCECCQDKLQELDEFISAFRIATRH